MLHCLCCFALNSAVTCIDSVVLTFWFFKVKYQASTEEKQSISTSHPPSRLKQELKERDLEIARYV